MTGVYGVNFTLNQPTPICCYSVINITTFKMTTIQRDYLLLSACFVYQSLHVS